MSETYTSVRLGEIGYSCHGRQTRDDAIAEARRHYKYQLDRALAFLNATDADLEVKVVRGFYKQKILAVLEENKDSKNE